MRLILTSILLLSLAGCSSLIVRNTDGPLETTAKIATRVVLFVPTLFISEVVIDSLKQEEAREAEAAAYASWYSSLSPQERMIESQRQHERDLMRMQAAAMMMPSLMYNTQQSFNNMRVNTPPPVLYQPVLPPPSLTCRSYPIGNNVNTECR